MILNAFPLWRVRRTAQHDWRLTSRISPRPAGRKHSLVPTRQGPEPPLEAKGSVTQENVWVAIEKFADYGQFLPNATHVILLPTDPHAGPPSLSYSQNVVIVWPITDASLSIYNLLKTAFFRGTHNNGNLYGLHMFHNFFSQKRPRHGKGHHSLPASLIL